MMARMTPQKQPYLPARLGYDGRNIPSMFTHPNNICRNLENIPHTYKLQCNTNSKAHYSLIPVPRLSTRAQSWIGGLGMRLENTQYSGTQIRSKCVLIKYAHFGEEGCAFIRV